jgi:hypothetical protein
VAVIRFTCQGSPTKGPNVFLVVFVAFACSRCHGPSTERASRANRPSGALRAHGPLLAARFARRACAYRVSTSKSFLFLQVGGWARAALSRETPLESQALYYIARRALAIVCRPIPRLEYGSQKHCMRFSHTTRRARVVADAARCPAATRLVLDSHCSLRGRAAASGAPASAAAGGAARGRGDGPAAARM